METIFTKIRDGEIPSVKLYEDDFCFVILDINPVHKGHALVISKEPYKNVAECPENVLQHMMSIAKMLDKKQRDVLHCDGTNIVINNDAAAGQEVPHLHIHVIPRYSDVKMAFGFSHEKYEDGEIVPFGEKLAL